MNDLLDRGKLIRSHFKNVFRFNPPAADKYLCWCRVSNPSSRLRRTFGLELSRAARVSAQPLGEDGILNQNPIFEIASK
jgi:hypothetical protein